MHTSHTNRIAALSLITFTAVAGCASEDQAPPTNCDVAGVRHGDYHSGTGLSELAGAVKLKGNLVIDAAQPDQLAQLACLESIEGDLVIVDNPAIADLRALSALTDVWGTVTIANNERLETLAGLESMWLVGAIEIVDNPSLRDLMGLSNVEALTHLDIVNNNALEDVSGLAQLERVGSMFVSRNDALQRLDFPMLDLVAKDLDISSNASLFDLAMPGLVTLGGELAIQWNPTLPTCIAQDLASQLADSGFSGPVRIEGNNDDGTCTPSAIDGAF